MDNIEQTARKYIKTPFRHQGRSKYGLDCVGLIIKVAHDLKLSTFDDTNYRVEPDPIRMRKGLHEHMDRIFKMEPNCVFYMAFFKNPQHLAIYTSNNTIIHSASIFGGVVEHRLDSYWLSKVKEIYRYRR